MIHTGERAIGIRIGNRDADWPKTNRVQGWVCISIILDLLMDICCLQLLGIGSRGVKYVKPAIFY